MTGQKWKTLAIAVVTAAVGVLWFAFQRESVEECLAKAEQTYNKDFDARCEKTREGGCRLSMQEGFRLFQEKMDREEACRRK